MGVNGLTAPLSNAQLHTTRDKTPLLTARLYFARHHITLPDSAIQLKEITMSEDAKNKPFVRSIDTSLLISRLKDLPVGTFVSYEDLSKHIGRTVTGSTGSLQSARRALLAEEGAIWDCCPGEGIQRLSDDQIATSRQASVRTRIKNVANKASKEYGCVNLEKVKDKEAFLAAMSYAGLIAQVSKQRSMKKLEAKVDTSDPQPLSIGVSLDALKQQ